MSALPACMVQIWAVDGSGLTFDSSRSGNLLSASTSKDIWDPRSGTFELILAPGGPYGPNAGAQWRDVINTMSLCVIAMQRDVPGAVRANVVMAGIITRVEESVSWQFGAATQRVTKVSGRDFSYFFDKPNAYSTTFLEMVGAALGGIGSAVASNGITSGTPDQIASQYFTTIMGKVLQNTKFSGPDGTIPFGQMVRTAFSSYPLQGVDIPLAWNWLATNGTWLGDFEGMFPWPWYEFSIITAQPGTYQAQTNGATLSIADIGFIPPAGPVAVARPLPLPTLTGAGGTLSLNTTLWDKLPVVTPDNSGFAILDISMAYDTEAVRNFYSLVPAYLGNLWGSSSQQTASFLALYGSWIDTGSIERYGYEPRIDNIRWFADPQGHQAQRNAGSDSAFQTLVGNLALVPVSFHQPAPLMMQGSLTLNLRPDITPGVKVQYVGDKSGTLWIGYVQTVSHNFVYGHASTTTLGICRALPLSVYQDKNTLLAMHMGQAVMSGGEYAIDPQAVGIKPFNVLNAVSDLADLSNAFNTPGAK